MTHSCIITSQKHLHSYFQSGLSRRFLWPEPIWFNPKARLRIATVLWTWAKIKPVSSGFVICHLYFLSPLPWPLYLPQYHLFCPQVLPCQCQCMHSKSHIYCPRLPHISPGHPTALNMQPYACYWPGRNSPVWASCTSADCHINRNSTAVPAFTLQSQWTPPSPKSA